MAERKLSPERRARILDAARRLILLHGLRATTMEAVAREARIAKPTLYGYFADKDAVFSALVQALADDIATAVTEALAGPGDVVARIGEALVAKHRVVAELLQGSPHADELYSGHDREAAVQFGALDRFVEEAIGGALGESGLARHKPLVRVLLAATYGVARKATDPAHIGPAIRLLTRRLLEPELSGG